MSNDINITIMSGTNGADVVLKYTQKNNPVINFSIISQEEYNGYKNSVWMDCVYFGKENDRGLIDLAPLLKKGVKLVVHGRIQKNSYEKDGIRKEKIQLVARSVEVCQRPVSYEAPVTQRQVQHNQTLMEEEENLDLPF